MRLTTVILVAALMQVNAAGFAQKLTYSKKGSTFSEIFKAIRVQTGYNVLYATDQVEPKTRLDVDFNETDLKQVLDKLSNSQPISYTIDDKNIVISRKEPSFLDKLTAGFATIDVRGVVVDEKGGPLPGVDVKLKGTSIGVTTNADGRYTLNVPGPDAVLIFSFVGFETQEKLVGSTTAINVVLKETSNGLNEVIVVGYGTQKRTDLVGSVSTISGKVLESRPLTNPLAGLQGTTPGLVITRTSGQPGKEGYSAQIRGASSVNGSSVLILVDGVEQTSIASLNPSDIASVSVLKDASAAAIYGARAAGGVMLVTTKKGKAGKTAISYSGMYTFNKPYNMPKRLHSYEEAQMRNVANANASASPAYTDQQIEWLKDPNVEYVVNAATGQYDWYYDLNQVPFMTRSLTAQQNHTIAVNGGDEKTQYLFSGGWLNQNGLFKVGPDGTDRYNARINITTNFNKWLSLDARAGYVQRSTLSPSMEVGGGSGILYNLYEIRNNYPIFFPGSDDTKYADGGSLAYPNLKDGGATTERTDAFNGVFTLQAKDVVKGLQLKAIYAPYLDSYNYNRTLRSVQLYQVSGATTNLNPTNAYYVTKQETYRSNYQFLADYDLTIANDHHFHALAGYQFENYRMTNVAASARNLSSNDLFSLNIGDPTQYQASDQIDTWATQSVFGRLSYNYREKYFLEGTARNDGSSRLAPGYRYKLFPSLSGGWRVAQEPWFKKAAPFINEFKIRGSIGNLGNSDLSNFGYYDYIALISRSTAYPFNNQINYGYYNATLASAYKTWENINTKDVGLDMAFLSNRLDISGDYYVKRNTNMLVQVKTTAMIGIGTSQYNYADLKNSGWEVRIGWRDQIGTNFKYWLNGNISNNKNMVSTYQGRSVITEGVNPVVEGLPLNTIWGYKSAGLYANAEEVTAGPFVSNTTGPGDIKYVDINGDGKINAGKGTKDDHGDLVNLGSTTPRDTYGFDFGFSFKGFDFSAFFQGVAEREMLINSAFMLPFVQSWRQPNQEQTDYWTPTHMDARFPRLYPGGSSNTLTSSWWVQNAAYLRLKNLQVGYNLPLKWASKAGFKVIRIYFSGQDLWENSKMWLKYYDPEEPTNASTSYPFFRSYAIGLNVTL